MSLLTQLTFSVLQYDLFLVISILVNILLILGCSGKRWRRALAFPWLIFYGKMMILSVPTAIFVVRLGCCDSHLDTSLLHFSLLEGGEDDRPGLPGGRLHISHHLVSR